MVDVVRRRGGRGRGRAAERLAPLGDVAAQYASMGWPVCLGAHPHQGKRAAMEPGQACSCDRVGCPAPGAHPVSAAWQMQATVDLERDPELVGNPAGGERDPRHRPGF